MNYRKLIEKIDNTDRNHLTFTDEEVGTIYEALKLGVVVGIFMNEQRTDEAPPLGKHLPPPHEPRCKDCWLPGEAEHVEKGK